MRTCTENSSSTGYSEKGKKMKISKWKGSLAISLLYGGLGLLGPQWRDCKSAIKGWTVKTAIHDKAMDFDGEVAEFKIRSFNGGEDAKNFRIFAFDKINT